MANHILKAPLERGKAETKTIEASIYYLQKLDLYKKEKPFMLTFDPSNLGGSRSNHEFVATSVNLINAQPIRSSFQLDVNGYEFHTWPIRMESAAFDNDTIVKDRYYPEVVERVKALRPGAVEVIILTHLVAFNQSKLELPLLNYSSAENAL